MKGGKKERHEGAERERWAPGDAWHRGGKVKENMWINGCVEVRILDKSGKVKRHPPPGYSRWRWDLWQTGIGRCLKKLLVFSGSEPWPEVLREKRYYQVVTWDWSYLFSDVLLNTEQFIEVGTGGERGRTPAYRTDLRCRRPAGLRGLDKGYPDCEWNTDGAGGTIMYGATFPAGALRGKTINEVCISAGNDRGSACLAYGRLLPGVALRRGEALQVRVELTCAVPLVIACEERAVNRE
jgi:hypothetical protein